MDNRPRSASIHVVDDDSLHHVFYFCRPFLLVRLGEDDITGPFGEHWTQNERWWYALAHVCQRWRNIILGSAVSLDVSLVCAHGAPIADILAHSPPLPLIVGYFTNILEPNTEEEGLIIALKQRDRIRRLRLGNPAAIMQRLIMTMDEEYPILEYLYTTLPVDDTGSILRFPETFQAPHLRKLTLVGFALPIGSRLLTTAVGLVTLQLGMVHPSTYFHPNTLLQWISLMPHLETLKIFFEFSISNRDVERQFTHTPIIAPITLPNLHRFHFRGVSTYLEALVHRIVAPRLKKLQIEFFNQLTYSIPRFLQFIDPAENLRFGNAVLTFSDKLVGVGVSPYMVTNAYTISIVVKCLHLDWQVSSIAQISNSLNQIFSAVETLFLQHTVPIRSSEEHNEVNRTEWRKLFRPFGNVKSLWIENGFVSDLSRCLELEDGELPLELLPELQVLRYYGNDDTGDAFASFIDARRNSARPVTLVRLHPPSSESSFETSTHHTSEQ
jgi:hypothetical protein